MYGFEFVFDTANINGELVRRVPEPSVLTLFAFGLVLLYLCGRRSRLVQQPNASQAIRASGEELQCV